MTPRALFLLACLALIGVVLLLRLADRSGRRDHLLVVGVATLAAGVCYRFLDVLQHLDTVRWPAGLGAFALLVFLIADWRTHRSPEWTGVERRRRPRVGTDPDQDFPRPE